MVDRNSEPVYEVVSPVGHSAMRPIPANPPLATLNGKVIGELWDWSFKGDEMFIIIREQLRRRYPDVRFVEFTTFGNTHGADEAEMIADLPNQLRKHGCDAVISSVGA